MASTSGEDQATTAAAAAAAVPVTAPTRAAAGDGAEEKEIVEQAKRNKPPAVSQYEMALTIAGKRRRTAPLKRCSAGGYPSTTPFPTGPSVSDLLHDADVFKIPGAKRKRVTLADSEHAVGVPAATWSLRRTPVDVRKRMTGTVDKLTWCVLEGRLKGVGGGLRQVAADGGDVDMTGDHPPPPPLTIMDYTPAALQSALHTLADKRAADHEARAAMTSSTFIELLAHQRLQQILNDEKADAAAPAAAAAPAGTKAPPLRDAVLQLLEEVAAAGDAGDAGAGKVREAAARVGWAEVGVGTEDMGVEASQASTAETEVQVRGAEQPGADADMAGGKSGSGSADADADAGDTHTKEDDTILVNLGLDTALRSGRTPPITVGPPGAAMPPGGSIPAPRRLRPYGKLVVLHPSASKDLSIMLPVVEVGRPSIASPARLDIAAFSEHPRQISRCHIIIVAEPMGMRLIPTGRNAVEVSIDDDTRALSANTGPLLVTQRVHITIADVTMVLIPG